MELDTETYCRICGAPLAWRYIRNDLVPLDVEPDPDGAVFVRTDNTAQLVTPSPALSPQLYRVHQPGPGCPDLCISSPSSLTDRPQDAPRPVSLLSGSLKPQG